MGVLQGEFALADPAQSSNGRPDRCTSSAAEAFLGRGGEQGGDAAEQLLAADEDRVRPPREVLRTARRHLDTVGGLYRSRCQMHQADVAGVDVAVDGARRRRPLSGRGDRHGRPGCRQRASLRCCHR